MRRLIVCCDGTWNTPDRRDMGVFAPSNVVKMARAILPQAPDGTPQVVYYSAGIGTDDILDKVTGGAFGVGISRHVREAYRFLLHNYADGDEIYFFGFSRGAYTVRSAAGLIRKAGLLHKVYADRDLAAWQLYRKRDAGPDTQEAQDFRAMYSRWPLSIRFMGVWDTVGALGIPGLLNFIARSRFQFHDVALSRSVEHAYQALAIDERRRFFCPALWEQHPQATSQKLEQAWFPGVHMDVGGGYRNAGLADGAFTWMVEKARGAGLAMDDHYIAQISQPDALAPLHQSRGFPYTLIPAYLRPIGRGLEVMKAVYDGGRANESIAPATLLRYQDDKSYRPSNLLEFLGGNGGQ